MVLTYDPDGAFGGAYSRSSSIGRSYGISGGRLIGHRVSPRSSTGMIAGEIYSRIRPDDERREGRGRRGDLGTTLKQQEAVAGECGSSAAEDEHRGEEEPSEMHGLVWVLGWVDCVSTAVEDPERGGLRGFLLLRIVSCLGPVAVVGSVSSCLLRCFLIA